MLKRLSLAAAALGVTALPAFAHLNPEEHGSFMAGVSHPFFGADHILAMVAVGIWASQIATADSDRKALWIVPSAFVGTMAVGFLMAVYGIGLPFVESAILASVIGLGLLVAAAAKLPAAAAAAVVGAFALFHGYAHGGELGSAGAWQFGLGFMIATALLHLAGIALGLGIARFGSVASRTIGALTAIAGLSLALGG
ncbi:MULTISPECIES: HupE/UreJ family protein [Rhizobium/Agrobacterium group]|uniref:Protein HupE n=1 Tax=Agrobacterium tomkonis CFBP 6623 TaxID=1183432 RepID=A0A1S7NPZ3_9HYPH|nr:MULTISPECIES: HupE/UreJ family protein [Rhizobium/Agrobacterium group]KRA60780.1 protein hupE [Rhizobium sp. Root651]QCL89516.1 protein hupE [Agrobacterium tumefaciens]TKT66559.1 protein hupE [Agrobacterium sp. LC34]CUX10084.1 Protein HupE [Agrobacterium tomkonis CFBP 6623]